MKRKIDILKLQKVMAQKNKDRRFLIKRSVNIEAYQQAYLEGTKTNLSELVRTILDQLLESEIIPLETG